MTEAEPVTLIVMAYNQQNFIEAAAKSAFDQTYRPLEIIFSDDCSTDDTFAIMKRLTSSYDGPHSIRLNRNDQNLGFIPHLNKVFEMCQGALIVYNAGDDISEPNRVAELYAAFRDTRPLLVHSDVYNMNPDGSMSGLVTTRHAAIAAMEIREVAVAMSLGIGASCAWNPDIVRLFGPIAYNSTYDDLIFFFRARLLGRIAHVPKPLLRYRYSVGTSNQYERHWTDQLELERKYLSLSIDTYCQRMLDCKRVTPEREDILEALQAEKDRAQFKRRLYSAPLKTVPECLTSWSKFEAALSVVNRLRKITFGARRERLKRAGLLERRDGSVVRYRGAGRG